MQNAAAILALLSTLTLGESATVSSLPVRRSSLLGFEVQGRVVEVEEAARRLASLAVRVRVALERAAARCRFLKVHGRFRTEGRVVDGRPQVKVTLYVDDWTSRKQFEVVREVVDACREAGLAVERGTGEVWVWAR